jgi:uncharacterized protein (DUF2237 family)
MSNVFGRKLKKCNCSQKITGYNRTGYCNNFSDDPGTHIVCARVTKEFLEYTYYKGNDLITPRRGFPGLVNGDCWCICVLRWIEAYKYGVAPPIYLESTDSHVLDYVPFNILKNYALDM